MHVYSFLKKGVQMTSSSSLSPGFSLKSNVATLMDMGFPRKRCVEALQKNLRFKPFQTLSDSKRLFFPNFKMNENDLFSFNEDFS